MLHHFGCPMHLGVGDVGLIKSLDYLNDRYPDLGIHVIPEVLREEDALPTLKNLNSVIATCDSIAAYTYNVLKKGDTPLFITGDHSAVMGSISAASAYAAEALGSSTGLIWVDAHPDINTDKTTVTGNIHGMPVAALLGKGDRRLTRFLTATPKLSARNIVMLGIRDIDPPEQIALDSLGIRYYTYDTICEKGLTLCLEECIAHLSHLRSVHLSFDIDSMDPALMPGVSVPVPGGFTRREVRTLFETLLPVLPIRSYDIVEFNAAHDKEDVTAGFIPELVELIHRLN